MPSNRRGSLTTPLIILAAFSFMVAWGWPPWNVEAGFLGHVLKSAEPAAVHTDFAAFHAKAHDSLASYHDLAGLLALGAALLGVVFAYVTYYRRSLDPADAVEQAPAVYRLLVNKWYFDEFYSVAFVRPVLTVAGWFRWFDTNLIDGIVDGTARWTVQVAKWDGRFDNSVVDGLVNVVASATYAVGAQLRRVQTGFLRSYILFLALAAVVLFVALSWFVSSLAAAR